MSISKEVLIYAPGSVSNVGPGFDLLGFALELPGDELLVRRNDKGELRLVNETRFDLPLDAQKNVAGLAALALLDELGCDEGFDLVFRKKIRPGSGLGSSAASCVAAVMGINALIDEPLPREALLLAAMEGEKAASGAIHADNIAPALLGGITLIRSYEPIDIKHIPYPEDLHCVVVHPEIEIRTKESRQLIPEQFPRETALKQCGNLAGLIAGLTTSDYGLISRSVEDQFAEPFRVKQIPDFAELKDALLEDGSLGAGLSGSGPTMFSLCRGLDEARGLGQVMKDHFAVRGIAAEVYSSPINPIGSKIL